MIVAGFGFRAAATLESLQDALNATETRDIAALATPIDKAQADAFQALARTLSLPVIEVSAHDMQSVETKTNSDKVRNMRGTGSVAEACAIAAAGGDATLQGPRMVSQDRLATCAIAIGAHR